MDVNENTYKIIGDFGRLAIDGNSHHRQNWGILFNTIQAPGNKIIDEAFILGEGFIGRWSEFGKLTYKIDDPFYAIEDSMFGPNRLTLTADEMRNRMSAIEYHQPVRIPVGSVYNALNDAFETPFERMKSRVIINPNIGQVHKNNILLMAKYLPGYEQIGFIHPKKMNIAFLLDKHSNLGQEHLKTDKWYECGIVDERPDDYVVIVDAKYRYFQGIEFLIHMSLPGGYFPESDEELHDSIYYKDEYKIQVPFVLPLNHPFNPIHIDCNLFVNILSVFRNFAFVDLFINDNPEAPFLMVGVKENDTYPVVEIAVYPLRQHNRGDVR